MRSVLCDRLFTSHGLLFAIYLSSLANPGAARLNHQQDALRRGLGINGHPMPPVLGCALARSAAVRVFSV